MCTLNRILTLIETKEITQQQFLKDMGFNKSTLNDWKSGRSKSYKKYIDKIADYFGVPIDYILDREEATYQPQVFSEQLADIIKCYNSLSKSGKEKAHEYMQMLCVMESQKKE